MLIFQKACLFCLGLTVKVLKGRLMTTKVSKLFAFIFVVPNLGFPQLDHIAFRIHYAEKFPILMS